MERGRLTGLDALRGIAALVVAVTVHAAYIIGPIDSNSLLNKGDVAVDLFFVISGFVFVHVYFGDGAMDTTARRFAIARFARLYPLHLLTLAVAALLLVFMQPQVKIGADPNWHDLALNLFLVQGLTPGFSFNAPAWSISVECCCYVLFYIAARWLPFDRFACAMVAIGIALCALGDPMLGRGLVGFFIGAMAYRHDLRWLLLGTPLLVFANSDMLHPALSLTVFPALVSFARNWRPPAVLVWLGDRSYSLYLWHMPIYWIVNVVVLHRAAVTGPLAIFAVAFGATGALVAAELSYRLFERPARSAIIEFTSRRRISIAL